MSDRVAVVGGSGFIGCYLARGLRQRGRAVVIFDRVPPDSTRRHILAGNLADVEFVEGDITVPADLAGLLRREPFGAVVNLAALQSMDWCNSYPTATYDVNVRGAIGLFELASQARVPRVIHVSSTGALVSVDSDVVNEDHAILDVRQGHPAGHYGASKAMSEIAAMAFAAVQGLDLIILRFPSVYGFGSPHQTFLAQAVQAVVAGEPFETERGADDRRDYFYALDAAEALIHAIDVPAARLSQRLFLIAGGRLYTDREVAEILGRLAPKSRVRIGPGLSPAEAAVDSIRATYDTSAAERQLGFKPRYDLTDGLTDYIRWVRSYPADRDPRGVA